MAGVSVPDSPLITGALEYAQKLFEPYLFNHAVRSWLFAEIGGVDRELFFDDAVSNEALIELRRFIIDFIERVEPETPQIWQWERNIET